MTESCSSSSVSSKVANLREQLSSVAWVQCDITSCMKWRKVDKAVVDELTSDAWWECSMNKDKRFNSCHFPEEDLQSFDELAKKAKLAVFKSELTPGSLVWAKTSGYCMWPALVTEDPIGGLFWEEVENEPDKGYYHVEFLGKSHCHLWVYGKHVELFGEGNASLAFQKITEKCNTSKTQQRNVKKRKRKPVSGIEMPKKEKRFYGGGTVEVAIEEAIRLLPLCQEKRLKVCRFVKDSRDLARDGKSRVAVPTSSHSAEEQNKTNKSGKPSSKKHKKNDRQRALNRKSNKKEKVIHREPDRDDDPSWSSSQRKNDVSFDFLTSLLDVSKEERFFLDIAMYKEKECYFRESLGNFCSHFGLSTPTSFVIWDEAKVNLFDLFMAVDDRGGFEEVSRCRQWSQVYFELTNYARKKGSTRAKAVYERYLYPYELYINDKDPSLVIKCARKHMKTSRQSHKPSKLSPTKSDSENESDMEDVEFIQALDELDDLLQTLHQRDGIVPDIYDNVTSLQQEIDEDLHGAWDGMNMNISGKDNHVDLDPITGSQPCLATEPEESAQVVPEIDFPSFSDSSSSSGDDSDRGNEEERNQPPLQADNEDDWVLHELHALEHGGLI